MAVNRLRAMENRVLLLVLLAKTEEVVWGWRKWYNVELHGLYSSKNIVMMIK
jgi:hypothetical protein